MKSTPVGKKPSTKRFTVPEPAANGHSDTAHRTVQISPPQIERATFEIIGTAPLVIHRFSQKAKNMMLDTMKAGSTAKKGKKREPLDVEA